MSILTFLFFASIFYFNTVNTTPVQTQSPTPEAYQEDLINLLDVVKNGLDVYLTPMISNLDQDDQDYVKQVALKGFAGYVNYVIYLVYEEQDLQQSTSENDPDVVASIGVDNSAPVPYLQPDCKEDAAGAQ